MKGNLLSITMLGVLLAMGAMVAPTNADLVSTSQDVAASTETVRGTFEGIDPAQRIITIQSEYPPENRGEIRLLAFSDPDVVKGLSKGDRVVVELDDHGIAQKIVKATPGMNDTPAPKNGKRSNGLSNR